jgi:hypothetical protein
LLSSFSNTGIAQSVGISADQSEPHPSAILDVKSNTKGMLVPRMRTVDRLAIPSPAEGLIVFDMNTLSLWVYLDESDGGWTELTHSKNGLWSKSGTRIYPSNIYDKVGIGITNTTSNLQVNQATDLANQVDLALSLQGTKYATLKVFRFVNGNRVELRADDPLGRIMLQTSHSELNVMHDQNSVVIGPTPYYGPTLMLSDRNKDPEIQFVRMFPNDGTSYFKGFIQINGDNLRLGTNNDNPEGKFIVRTNGADRVAVDKNGNMGIGTLSPGFRLQVGNSGDGSVARANSWTTFSDERFKKDIISIDDALDKIDHINGYYYNWKNGEDKTRQAGLLAQEVEEVLPEIVSTDGQGYKSVDYGKMNALLLQALKEQQQLVKKLEKRVSDLERKSSK